ncbi:MAG: hypothetical protein CFE37_10080 [Alphaproteobacteria bacterium PA4]|nr:MAG: hypothetical protein CFE37_10080 [Alphaproteobacteria bacterium PA4]
MTMKPQFTAVLVVAAAMLIAAVPVAAACTTSVRNIPVAAGAITLFKLENGAAVPTGRVLPRKPGETRVTLEDCGSTKYLRWRDTDGTGYLILQSEMNAVAECVCLAQRTDISGTPAAAPCGKCP